MKIIFSRKGVDSAAGKCASALIDGRPVSIPIPTREPSPTTYGMLSDPLRTIASDLSSGALALDRSCHLDPDIEPYALSARPTGWRGALGQVSASLTHLRNQSVAVGDLFIFWGLYRPAEFCHGKWRYAGPRQHAIFGWLKIGAVLDAGSDGSTLLADYPWLAAHPHVRPYWTPKNCVYIAADGFHMDGRSFPGSGVLSKAFRLTDAASDRPREC